MLYSRDWTLGPGQKWLKSCLQNSLYKRLPIQENALFKGLNFWNLHTKWLSIQENSTFFWKKFAKLARKKPKNLLTKTWKVEIITEAAQFLLFMESIWFCNFFNVFISIRWSFGRKMINLKHYTIFNKTPSIRELPIQGTDPPVPKSLLNRESTVF